MNITPTQAKTFLQLNEGNRKIRKTWVDELVRRIEEGEWRETHQGILFSSSGRLLDGQHRLMAIYKSGHSLTLPVFYTDDEESFKVIDQGQKRSLNDLTGYDRNIISPTRFLVRMGVNSALGNSVFIIEDILNSPVGEAVFELNKVQGMRNSAYSGASVRAAAALTMVAQGNRKEYIKDLFDVMQKLDFPNMPTVGQSYCRQVQSGKISSVGGGTTQRENFFRAMFLFDYRNRNSNVIRISDTYRQNCVDLVKKTLRPIVEEGY